MTQGGADARRASERAGLLYATAGFLVWGVSPAFWKLLPGVPALQLLAHRIVWCTLLMVALLAWRRDRGLAAAIRDPRTLATLIASTLLIGTNWYGYIYAVVNEKILQASLGYFINPLINVLLGVLFLREELRARQRLAVGIAAVGVAILTWRLGELPWLSLFLAISFGLYGLVRKTVNASPEQGLALETLLLAPLSFFFLMRWQAEGVGAWGEGSWSTDLLLIATGAITALPLLLFTHGARRLPLSTIGLLQYIAPTCQFLLAVVAYREPFDRVQLLAFLFIWTALAIFTLDLRRASSAGSAR
ncbi:MAG: EamA family transporter RarD [Acidobacteriota bacterium]